MGHMLNQTEMDIIIRWHRMRGYLMWLPGTDHAGIATQMMVERQLASEAKIARRSGARHSSSVSGIGGALWRGILDQMKRLGACVDWAREYFTMDDRLCAPCARPSFGCMKRV